MLIVPEHIWKSISNPVTYVDDNPVGTGPYTVSSFSAQEFTFVRNPNYWQKGLPKIATLHFLSYASNPSAGLAISSGTIDWNTVFMPNYKTGFVDKNPKQHFESVYPIGNFFMCPNLTAYPFNKTVVRQALSEAIDRPDDRERGRARLLLRRHEPDRADHSPLEQLAGTPVRQGLTLTFNPSAAKKLLEKNGFKVGSNGMLNEPNGKPFTVALLGPTPYTDWMTDLQLMANEMQKAGISASVDGVSVSCLDQRLHGRQLPADLLRPVHHCRPVLDVQLHAEQRTVRAGRQAGNERRRALLQRAGGRTPSPRPPRRTTTPRC